MGGDAEPRGAAPPGERLKIALAGAAGGALLTSLMRTTRLEIVSGREHYLRSWGERRPAIYLLWHGRLLPCAYFHRDEGLGTLISRHRDGDYIARVVEGWGFRPVRGSSSRGAGSALLQLVRLLREGTALALTPDGPRGPRQKMKIGPVRAAQLAGVPLIPVSAGADRAWWFGGWDRFLVPKPFSRVRYAYGEPVMVPREAGEEEIRAIAEGLERRLDALTELVDAG